jgi:uncharacterized membrane protein YbaN (DUF454 family)
MNTRQDTPFKRHMLFAAGILCLLLAILGFLLPVMPGAPFLLAAIACFSRSSEKMHRWILALPGVGRVLAAWERNHSLSIPVKLLLSLVLVGFTAYPVFVEEIPTALRWTAGTICLLMLAFVWSRPTRTGD